LIDAGIIKGVFVYNTLYVSPGNKNQKEVDDIQVYYTDSTDECIEKLRHQRIDAVVVRDSGERGREELVRFVKNAFLPISIIYLNGNKKIEVDRYVGNFGALIINAPDNEFSVKKSIDLVTKHQRLLKNNLKKKYTQLRNGVIEAFLQALRIKDSLTYQHVLRLEILVEAFSRYLKVPKEDTLLLKMATLLHDVGKIGIIDSILNKTSKLTPVEFEIMKTHVELGCQIVSQFEDLQIIIPIMRHHHEKLDGTGYPDGISGDAIPYLTRILTIVDTYDSLTSNRIYRSKKPFKIAIDIMEKELETAFDRHLFNKFKQFIEDSEIFLKVYHQMNR
jgi:putative nucleotidyltransferase with HDIG domain